MEITNSKQIAFNIQQALTRISDCEMKVKVVSKWNSDSTLFFDEYEKRRRIDKFNLIMERWRSYAQGQCITLLTKI